MGHISRACKQIPARWQRVRFHREPIFLGNKEKLFKIISCSRLVSLSLNGYLGFSALYLIKFVYIYAVGCHS